MSHPHSLSLGHDPYAKDYSNHNLRKAFKKLPIEDQLAVEAVHLDAALTMEHSPEALANTKNAITTVIERKPTEVKETTPNNVEMDSENYGAPPENSGIEINAKKASYTQPQAWEDEHGNWFYNFPGALRLAKVLGRTLPNIGQFLDAIDANPDNFRQSAGSRRGHEGDFYERDEFSSFWSSSEGGSDHAYSAFLKQGSSSAGKGWYPRHYGLSVRFIVDKK